MEHNMEFVTEIKGIFYVNDASAENMLHTAMTLEKLESQIVLIIGGNDRAADYNQLSEKAKSRLKGVIYLGEQREKILRMFRNQSLFFAQVNGIEEAVHYASGCALRGDIILYSPGCPARAFDTYKTRGNEFKELVRKIEEAKE